MPSAGGFVFTAKWIKTITCVPSTLRENTIQNFVYLRQGLELFCRSLTSRSQRSAYLCIKCLYHCTQTVPVPFGVPGCSLIWAFFFPQPCDSAGMSSLHFLFFLTFFFSLSFFVRKKNLSQTDFKFMAVSTFPK